jgi:hypothetical protein
VWSAKRLLKPQSRGGAHKDKENKKIFENGNGLKMHVRNCYDNFIRVSSRNSSGGPAQSHSKTVPLLAKNHNGRSPSFHSLLYAFKGENYDGRISSLTRRRSLSIASRHKHDIFHLHVAAPDLPFTRSSIICLSKP